MTVSSIRANEQTFEVVSIHEVPRDAPPLMRELGYSSILPGGRFVDPRISLNALIIIAFEIPSYTQLKGLPRWAQDQTFSITAKPPEGFPSLTSNENTAQVRAMMREMLASRFHLKLHTEDLQERILSLQADRKGLKLKPVEPPVPPEKEGFVNLAAGDVGGRMIGNKVTTAGVARALTTILHQQVRDDTGSTGYYSFDFKWSVPEQLDGARNSSRLGEDGVAGLISALKDLFGIRVTSAIGPIKYWVVDNVEHPTPN